MGLEKLTDFGFALLQSLLKKIDQFGFVQKPNRTSALLQIQVFVSDLNLDHAFRIYHAFHNFFNGQSPGAKIIHAQAMDGD